MVVISKKPVSWHNSDQVITTPSQVRSHIEKCKDWLLSSAEDEEGEDEEIELFTQPIRTKIEPQLMNNIGLVQTRIYTDNYFYCFVCQKKTCVEDGQIINANPFTRAYSMMVCGTC